MYVMTAATNSVLVIDTATNTVTATIPIGVTFGPVPGGVAVTPNGDFVYASNQIANAVSVISTATNTVTATIPVGVSPISIDFGVAPPSPTLGLRSQVLALVAAGSLTPNQGDTLLSKLDQVDVKLASGQPGAACNQLNSFINHVNSFINNGPLTQTNGQPLIDGANAIRASLGCQ